jgi:hypothetical protein
LAIFFILTKCSWNMYKSCLPLNIELFEHIRASPVVLPKTYYLFTNSSGTTKNWLFKLILVENDMWLTCSSHRSRESLWWQSTEPNQPCRWPKQRAAMGRRATGYRWGGGFPVGKRGYRSTRRDSCMPEGAVAGSSDENGMKNTSPVSVSIFLAETGFGF